MSTGKRKIQIKIADFNYLTYQMACCEYDIIQCKLTHIKIVSFRKKFVK